MACIYLAVNFHNLRNFHFKWFTLVLKSDPVPTRQILTTIYDMFSMSRTTWSHRIPLNGKKNITNELYLYSLNKSIGQF